jgi:hypothetical protein
MLFADVFTAPDPVIVIVAVPVVVLPGAPPVTRPAPMASVMPAVVLHAVALEGIILMKGRVVSSTRYFVTNVSVDTALCTAVIVDTDSTMGIAGITTNAFIADTARS